jgi:hypothetical protein
LGWNLGTISIDHTIGGTIAIASWSGSIGAVIAIWPIATWPTGIVATRIRAHCIALNGAPRHAHSDTHGICAAGRGAVCRVRAGGQRIKGNGACRQIGERALHGGIFRRHAISWQTGPFRPSRGIGIELAGRIWLRVCA